MLVQIATGRRRIAALRAGNRPIPPANPQRPPQKSKTLQTETMLRSLGRVLRRAAAAPRSAGGGCARRALATHVLNVPAMGDSITEGTVASVEKAVGDAVAVDEIVAVIDTDKVSVDVLSLIHI